MDPKLAQAIGLFRHQMISPVLTDSVGAQREYFQKLASQPLDVPGQRGMKRFSASTFKGWLTRFRKHGFQAIMPKTRSDAGKIRRLTPEQKSAIKKLREENLDRSAIKFYGLCVKGDLLGSPPACLETLRRYLKSENLYRPRQVSARKRFEMSYVGELWTCDFMHGPHVLEDPAGKRRKKSILLAVIDDYSRLIVGYRWGFAENTKLIELVFKDAILSHGLCDRLYCDNGPSFSSQYLSRVCAHLGAGLVHSKPYDSPSRGKIERFFRTVREGFLSGIAPEGSLAWAQVTLNGINESFSRWLRDEYHHAYHRGIDARPIDRYQMSIRDYPRKRVDEERLDELFLVTVDRTVGKDCTVSLHGNDYEVPPQYVGRRVELKFSQEDPNDVFLYENAVRVTRIALVNGQFNAKIYRPSPRISDVALHEVVGLGTEKTGGAS